MASASGSSSGSAEDQIRKRKRMESNRESARRSRIRRQKHVDDLMSEAKGVEEDNRKILAAMKVTREQLSRVEAENSVLRARMGELGQRLDSLNEIMNCVNNGATSGLFGFERAESMNDPWEVVCVNQQPVMASAADVFEYW